MSSKQFQEFCLDLFIGQLEPVAQILTNMASNIQESILELNEQAELKSKMAREIIVKNHGDKRVMDASEVTALSELASNEKKPKKEKPSNNKTRKKLTDEMSRLSEMEAQLQDKIFSVIGILSREDVIAQRIRHLLNNARMYQQILVRFGNSKDSHDQDEFYENISNLVRSTAKSFTTEEQKKILAEYFNINDSLNKAI